MSTMCPRPLGGGKKHLLSRVAFGEALGLKDRFSGNLSSCEIFTVLKLLIKSWIFFLPSATLVTDYFQIHQIHKLLFLKCNQHTHAPIYR